MNSRRFLPHQYFLAVLLMAAFLIRLGMRAAFGEEYFWTNSYSAYYNLAENVVAGKGFCFETTCAWWPPLYTAFLAVTALAGKHYLLIVVPQALMGAGTAFIAFLIGRDIFNVTSGILACGITALYPYYVMHDTALQETGMVTFGMALSVWLLLRAGRLNRYGDWFLAGVALGAVALTRASVAPSAGMALLWTAGWGTQGKVGERLRKSGMLLFALILMLAPWLIRTKRLSGAPVLSSQTGRALWIANNAETFSYYPWESIDRSTDVSYSKLTGAEYAELERLLPREIESSNWYARRGLEFIRANPALTVRNSFRKLLAGFSWRMSPRREWPVQMVYAIVYVPVSVLGVLGMLRSARNRETILVALLFLSFAAVSMVFWAHTSHRTYLDIYWIVFASSMIRAGMLKTHPGKRLVSALECATSTSAGAGDTAL